MLFINLSNDNFSGLAQKCYQQQLVFTHMLCLTSLVGVKNLPNSRIMLLNIQLKYSKGLITWANFGNMSVRFGYMYSFDIYIIYTACKQGSARWRRSL